MPCARNMGQLGGQGAHHGRLYTTLTAMNHFMGWRVHIHLAPCSRVFFSLLSMVACGDAGAGEITLVSQNNATGPASLGNQTPL